MFRKVLGPLLTVVFLHAGISSAHSNTCDDNSIEDIPTGNYFYNTYPENPDTSVITQQYNTSRIDGYCLVNGAVRDAGTAACDGRFVYFGHDGIDISEAGDNWIYSIQNGRVVASLDYFDWGESIAIATRTNQYSDEILTFHYHHMKREYTEGGTVTTTRQFFACDDVDQSEEIGKEGNTGFSVSTDPNNPCPGCHVHITIRRWPNIVALNRALQDLGAFWGSAYAGDDDTYFYNEQDPDSVLTYLNPLTYLTDKYTDVNSEHWADEYVRYMRYYGIEFGKWDDGYGVSDPVKRKEAARWIKIAALVPSCFPDENNPIFQDVNVRDNEDAVYIETLSQFPPSSPVVDSGATYFEPNCLINRAEAVKMIVLAFYSSEFLDEYGDYVWTNSQSGARSYLENNLIPFQDVAPTDWFAAYVYFGLVKGIVDENTQFDPAREVNRAEVAKMIIAAKHDTQGYIPPLACGPSGCPLGQYCSYQHETCVAVAECVPSENTTCALGGGCITSSCGSSGLQCGTHDDGCDGIIDCGGCQSGAVCSALGVCVQTCGDSICDIGAGENCNNCPLDCGCDCVGGDCCDGCCFQLTTHVCGTDAEYSCYWGTACDEEVGVRYRDQFCSGASSGCDGTYGSWSGYQVHQYCSSDETCTSGSWTCSYDVSCTGGCTATDYWSPTTMTASSCTSGICLNGNFEKVGSDIGITICKQNGTFTNSSLHVQYTEQIKHTANIWYSNVLSANGTCSAQGVMNMSSWSDGEGHGGDLRIVSPDSCASNYNNTCTLIGPSCGYCWIMSTGIQNRTCKQ